MIADRDLIHTWLEAWAIGHETSPPTPVGPGWHVDVGRPDQVARYVFASAEGVAEVAELVTQPLVYIKVCVALEDIAHLFPPRWELERRGLMMTRDDSPLPDCPLPDGYRLDLTTSGVVTKAIIHGADGVAASGRVVINGKTAMYDEILTHADHRRRGLGRAMMHALHQAARGQGATRDVLSASMMGCPLYQSLGWQIHAFYTSAVIRAENSD